MVDHASEGQEMLLLQFKHAPNLQALMAASMEQAQSIEDQLGQLHRGKYIDMAWGRRLDILGKLVGQPRDGMDDALYKLWIKARIIINRSSGTASELAAILRVILGCEMPLRLQEHPEIAFTAHLLKPLRQYSPRNIFALINGAKPLGVKALLNHAVKDPTFLFDVPQESTAYFCNLIHEEAT